MSIASDFVCALNDAQAAVAMVAPTREAPGKKWDAGKRRWDLLPWDQVGQIVDILGHGADKYGENNWRELARFDDRYFAAVMRHLTAWRRGERIDPDSGHTHLAHAACGLLFLMWGDRGHA